MKLLALPEWRKERFLPPRPTLRTCRNWCVNGDVPAVRRGGLWFIDIEQEENQTGNDLVDSVLSGKQ